MRISNCNVIYIHTCTIIRPSIAVRRYPYICIMSAKLQFNDVKEDQWSIDAIGLYSKAACLLLGLLNSELYGDSRDDSFA